MAYHIQNSHRGNQYGMGRNSDTLLIRNHIHWGIGSPLIDHSYPDKLEQLSNTRVHIGDLVHYRYEINVLSFRTYA